MNFLERMPYKSSILYEDDLKFQDKNLKTYVSRHCSETDVHDHYYLRMNIMKQDGTKKQLGYLYFYIDDKNHSKFIGLMVNPEYRNCGLASLLISEWIQLNLNEGLENLETIPKQRKPFLLYMLKRYSFELGNLETYQTSDRAVSLYQKEDSLEKYLMFRHKGEEKRFQNSNIMKTDNYVIIEQLEENMTWLDDVVLYSPYYLQDKEKAYQKSIGTYNKYR